MLPNGAARFNARATESLREPKTNKYHEIVAHIKYHAHALETT